MNYKVKHTKSFSNQYFGEHPHKYNLFGISKMLSDYGVKNGGAKVKDKEKDIFEIETPFIAHTGSDFATVYKVKPDKVHYNIGYLLVLKQLHIHSEYADKICSLFKQSDCNNVLESKTAKLWNFIGWSEIGLGYFIANTLIILFCLI